MTACTSASSNYSDLNAEPSTADELPVALQEDDLLNQVNPETVRSIGSHEGASLWLAESASLDEVCLIASTIETTYQAACGASFTLEGLDGSFAVYPDTGGAPEGAGRSISKNVYAIDS